MVAVSPIFDHGGTEGNLVLTRKDLQEVVVHADGPSPEAEITVPLGDFEFHLNSSQIEHGFRSTRIRVGDPWTCGRRWEHAPELVVMALFGRPGEGMDQYLGITRALIDAVIPVTVVLALAPEIPWTEGIDGPCSVVGDHCDHHSCDKEFCEFERWSLIVAGLRAASPNVRVAGLVNVGDEQGLKTADELSAQIRAGRIFGVFNAYFAGHDGSGRLGFDAMEVLAESRVRESLVWAAWELQEPLFHPPALTMRGAPDLFVTSVSGDVGVWGPFSWYPEAVPWTWGAFVDLGQRAEWEWKLYVFLDGGFGAFVVRQPGHVTKLVRALSFWSGRIKPGQSGGGRRLGSGRYLGHMCDDSQPRRCSQVCVRREELPAVATNTEACAAELGDLEESCCPCYHDAGWDEEGNCMAARGPHQRQRVGDLVCAGLPRRNETVGEACSNATDAHRYANVYKPVPAVELPLREEALKSDEKVSAAAAFVFAAWLV
jgi:hypothetical protein